MARRSAERCNVKLSVIPPSVQQREATGIVDVVCFVEESHVALAWPCSGGSSRDQMAQKMM